MKIFETISKNSSLSVQAFFICLGVALVVGVIFSYLCSFKMRSSKRFFVTVAMLPAIVTLVVAFVNREIGTGIAIAGAFSLVRFRSAQGSAEEIVVVFVAMAGGLAFGTGYIAYVVIFLLAMGLIYLVLEYTNIWSHKKQKEERILKITIPEDLSYASVFDDLFKKYTTSHELVGVTRHIHFQSQFVVVDIITGLIVVQIGCQPDDADAGARGTVFGVAVHGVDDILSHCRHCTVCDTVIHIDGKQITGDSDTDAIIRILHGAHRIKIREALRIGGIGPFAVCPVGNLGHAFIPLFLFPVTKMRSLFKLAG